MTSLVHKLRIVVVLIFITSQFSFSQVEGDKANLSNDIKYTEELFIQTDRDIYIVGESVFFKIFKLNGITRTPGNISQVVYVELLDNFNNPVTQLKIYVNGFSGSGEFRLPETLSTGNYLIRSCTHWMQNFSSDLFSYKRISVINPFEDVNKIKPPVPGQEPDSIVFYPESGSLISGIETVVGFRCFDFNGNPAGITGIVIDSDNDTLCRIQSDSKGYGFFSIKPSGNRNIYLVSVANRSKSKRYPLPVVKDSGVGFSVITTPVTDYFKINIRWNGTINNDRKSYFLLYSPVATAPLKKELAPGADAEVMFQKENLPYGLASIMIIDDNGTTIAKRWVYNEKMAYINCDIQLKNRICSTREKVIIDISATDPEGNPVKSDMMISVVKSSLTDKANSGNSPGYLQLPLLATMATDYEYSDINGYLLFYSNEGNLLKSDKSNPAGISVYLPELRGHLVSGIIRNATSGKTLDNESIVLSFVGEKAQCRFSKTDDTGYFNFVICESGTREVVIQPLSSELNDYYVELKNPFPQAHGRYKTLPFYPDSSKLAEINRAIISMQVKSIYKPFMRPTSIRSAYDEPDFYGEPDDTILISRFIELNSLEEIIKEIVPWVSIYEKNGKSKFRVIRGPLSLPFESDPLMLVDGVPVKDLDLILTIDPNEMEKIEILRERYLISDIVLEGIIHFITKKGNLSLLGSDNPVFRQEFQALQPVNSFDWPDYSNDTLKHSRIPDFRNTLYWDADLNTGNSGKTTVEFYTSDEPGEYTIIVEGMTSDGRTCRSETLFQVKEENIR